MNRFLLCFLFSLCSLGLWAQGEMITDTTKMSYHPIAFLSIDFYRVNYTYQSVGPDGQTPVTLSAAMVFSKSMFERSSSMKVGNKSYYASGLLLVSHYTMTKNSDAPTQTTDMQVEGPIMVIGPNMIIISPDGYGFGVTADKPQAYLMAETTARNNMDAVKAARRLLDGLDYTYGDLFAQVGYSQGAHSAIATQRFIDNGGADPEGITHIDYTLCGGGPYDISSMLDTLLLPEAKYMYPCAIPLIIHGQIAGAGLNIDYSDIFRAPLDTKATGWLDAKTLTTDEINDLIYAEIGGNSSTGVLVSDMLRTENLSKSNETMKPFFEALKENSLVSGWIPNKKTRFYLYHSTEDEIVPSFCTQHLYDYLKNKCGLSDNYLEKEEGTGKHTEAASDFVVNAITKLKKLQSSYLDGSYIPVSITSPFAEEPETPRVLKGWFNLQGQRLPDRPQASGIYIHDGKKVVVF